eukprot:4956377-Pleurochrysis_carterae.AAC.1
MERRISYRYILGDSAAAASTQRDGRGSDDDGDAAQGQGGGKSGVNWTVDFDDGEDPVVLARKVLRFARRERSAPDGTTRRTAIAEADDEGDDGAAAEEPAEDEEEQDSSDDEMQLLPPGRAGDPEHDGGA